jgi:hypothetical protein
MADPGQRATDLARRRQADPLETGGRAGVVGGLGGDFMEVSGAPGGGGGGRRNGGEEERE